MVPAACALFPQRWYLSHCFPLQLGSLPPPLALLSPSREGRDGHPMGAGWRVSLFAPFPRSSLALASLEPELRDSIVAKHGDKVPYVYFNKGL